MAETIDLSDPPPRRRFWPVLAGWTAIAAIMALILNAQQELPFRWMLPSTMFYFYSLGILVWIAWRIHERFALWKQGPSRLLAIHTGLGIVAITIWFVVELGFNRLFVGPEFWQKVWADSWMYQLLTTTLAYAASLGLGLTVQGFDRERERQQREAQLEVDAREAELAAIKAQLQPHFLLNSLNSILALIDHDPTKAREMVTRLASLLHSVFDRLEERLVPLERELDTIRDYLEIEHIRFGDRLRFSVEVEMDARQIAVPPFLLQPLVENAVKHGIAPHARPGEIRLTAALDGALLQVTIADTGDGFNGAGPAGPGRGLDLTRRRLDAVYGNNAASFRTERDAGGFTIHLGLPVIPDAG
jgi:two-component system LytT family sensor kinase